MQQGLLVHERGLASHAAIDLTGCKSNGELQALCQRYLACFMLRSYTRNVSSASTAPLFSQVRNAAVDYVDVRARVANAFPEKAHEMSALITVLQTLSKETAALTESIHTHCGVKMAAKAIANRTSLRG